MFRFPARALIAAGSLVAVAVAPPPELLLGPSEYPLEVTISFEAGLFHWLESLVGASGGKTVSGYRQEYQRRFGPLAGEDQAALLAFARVRRRHAETIALPELDVRGPKRLRARFFAGEGMEAILASLRGEMDEPDIAHLRAALERFRVRYAALWQEGAVPRRFVRKVRSDPEAARLGRMLRSVARFYGVDPVGEPRPRLVLVPVPDGWGTHAEAIDEALLVEVRTGDGLADQASVVVHENAHLLFARVDETRRRGWEAMAASIGPSGSAAWRKLHEALPTALGQGVADEAFRPRLWSRRERWYHTDEVDAYAKALYPLVRETLERGGRLDDHLVRRAIALDPAPWAAGRGLSPG